ncbi:FmdE family protein [Desulfovibrio inopinatus]|uniref:FmdE family protein n=1 Tax=Desulfovibrio inopinatus TaxID=102109 RepID=UPI00040D0F36|nr:FmdE family protein [Desulfovibrio inopinatus]
MQKTFTPERIERVIEFHGHNCPGLSIGIRAAELARLRWPDAKDSELVAVVETDMCGVDAIQDLLGCTFGKGNLIHRDFGKMAFSFYYRPTGEGFRALLRPEARGGNAQRMTELMQKMADNCATPEECAECAAVRMDQQNHFMSEALDTLFEVAELPLSPPRPARVLESLQCSSCKEMTMESRTRRYNGQHLCIPCFEKVEQKMV